MNKKIKTAIVFVLVWLLGILIHKAFLNLDFEVLRSFIVATGSAAWYYLYKE